MTEKSLGQIAYQVVRNQPWAWILLPPISQRRWEDGAAAVIAEYERRKAEEGRADG